MMSLINFAFCADISLPDPYGQHPTLSFHELRTILCVFRDITTAINHTSAQLIYHRDIKPANLIVHDGHGYLIDWGLPPRRVQAMRMNFPQHWHSHLWMYSGWEGNHTLFCKGWAWVYILYADSYTLWWWYMLGENRVCDKLIGFATISSDNTFSWAMFKSPRGMLPHFFGTPWVTVWKKDGSRDWWNSWFFQQTNHGLV